MLGIGLQLFFGGCLFSMALKIAAQFRRATLSLQYPECENFSGDCFFFNGPQEAVCHALAPFTALPVFPGFFPKLFCGRKKINAYECVHTDGCDPLPDYSNL